MARGLSLIVSQVLLLAFLRFASSSDFQRSNLPEFYSVSVINDNFDNFHVDNVRKVEFKVHGRNLYKGMHVKATNIKAPKNSECRENLTIYKISEVWTNATEARYIFELPQSVNGNVYLCLPQSVNNPTNYLHARWLHQGENVFIHSNTPKFFSSSWVNFLNNNSRRINRQRRQQAFPDEPQPKLFGLRVDHGDNEIDIEEDGVPNIFINAKYILRLFGQNLNEDTYVTFTNKAGELGKPCLSLITDTFRLIPQKSEDGTENMATVTIKFPETIYDEIYVCLQVGDLPETRPSHQGTDVAVKLKTHGPLMPVWVQIMIIILCLCFSALFSGLNLGLMSMDRTELKIMCNTGTPRERKYAKSIQPVRNYGNYLLCSILLGNVFVNSIFTILFEGLTSGVIAVIFSTLAIVIFGEITPQAVCSRHGLAVGAKTIYITKFVMFLTAPLSYPVSKFLDFVLGEEIGNVYNRERLKELLKVQDNDLDKDELNIISGALELCKKTVADVMTRIEDVFMLNYNAILDFETVSDIMKSGYSRIPVYEENRCNIVTMLYIKDLAFVDPDDNTPLKTLCQFYQNPCNFVFEDVTLDVMFRIFKEGNKGHMAFVHRVNSEGEGDPFYETIGLITLEDVIEELIQAEIMDETDVFTDNRTKRRRNANRARQDFSVFADKNVKVRISPQLTLATYQYLSTSVDPFKFESISERIIRRLLKHDDVFHHIKKTKDWKNDPSTVIYQQGKPSDYFVLVIEGRVEVTVGKENLIFESGPFTYFGIQALTQNIGGIDEPPLRAGSVQSLTLDSTLRCTFTPDYTVRASTEVYYLKITRQLYLAAKKGTLLERSQHSANSGITSDQFDDEVEKLLHSLEEDGSIGRTSPDPKNSSNQPAASSLSQNNTSKTASPRSTTSQISNHQSPSVPNKKLSLLSGDGVHLSELKNDEETKLLNE